jgi:carboxyl-terminal processing protease
MESSTRRRTTRQEAHWRLAMVLGLGLLIAVTSFGAGLLTQRDIIANSGVATGGSDGTDNFARFNDVRSLIENEYYGEPAEPTAAAAFNQNLEYAAIQGMIGTLDKFSTFLVPAAQTAAKEQLSGEYQGIGIWVDFPQGKLTIISPIPGSPAAEAGLKAGDVIDAVDGVAVTDSNEDDALTMVRGPEGSTVRLTISRTGTAAPFDVDVVRKKIPVKSVNYRPIPDRKLAYIQITVFGDNTTNELDAALKQAQADGAVGIVLDLRNNGGGWVQSAQEMIGRFVPADRGPALYEELNPDGSERTPEPIMPGELKLFDIPLVVLVNGGTASASEIVTGALRDYGRATVIGEQTFGKGSVQRVHDFDDGTSARITFAEWLTPNLSRLQGQGVHPDIVVAPDPNNADEDVQLDAAIAYLATGGTPTAAPAAPIATPMATPVASPEAGVTGDAAAGEELVWAGGFRV